MPQPILTDLTVANCPHAIPVKFTSSAAKVKIEGGTPLVMLDKGTVTGVCPFTVPPSKPQPCALTLLPQTAIKVLVENRPVILQSPGDLCQSADLIPNGPVAYGKVQSKVIAT